MTYAEYLASLEVGDTVIRNLYGIHQPLKVTRIDDLIHCGPWAFHKTTGAEVDLEIGMDGVNVTCSMLLQKETP